MLQKFSGLKKLLVVALVAIFALSVVGCTDQSAPEEGREQSEQKGTIEIGMVNWAECVANSNLWKVILEDMGYKVNLTQLEAAPLYLGLNKGDIDVFLDAWLPITQGRYWEEYQGNLEDLGIWYPGARIGLVVPQYVDINSIEELAENKDKFGGEIIGIDPGAGIMLATERALEDYGLDFKVIQGSEAAMLSALKKAYEKGEWIVVTGWTPHWKFAEYDLKFLDDPKLSYGEAEQLHVLANKDFSNKFPEVAEMLKKFSLNDDQIGSLEALINEGMAPEEAARQWIEDNRELVNSWIAQ
ncbi:MAG: glycine betaine ABC transporter substrate-binding protein [Clostridia bacterium]|nr:glycine betaine ABC transporter substrate-binding protein [Clostridia bacterium]